MTFGDKLAKLRRENNHTQEQLAELLGVSRQAVSRWEANAAYPETEKLIRIGRLYRCSMDYLLLDEVTQSPAPDEPSPKAATLKIDLTSLCYERVSRKKIGSLPLWHVNIGHGRVAKGVFAVGLRAQGIVSVGVLSLGVVSVGVVGLGLLSIGSFAFGLLALGAISVGVLSLGAVAFGIFSIGACAIGQFAAGAAALGKYAALGDAATAQVALGFSDACGSIYQAISEPAAWDVPRIRAALEETVPGYLTLFRELFMQFLQ